MSCRHEWDAWKRERIKIDRMEFVAPLLLPFSPPGMNCDVREFRRQLKQIAEWLDLMVLMPQGGWEIVQMDSDPPTRLYSNIMTTGDQAERTSMDRRVLDAVRQATWMSNKLRAMKYAAERERMDRAEAAERKDVVGDVVREFQRGGRTWSSGALGWKKTEKRK